MGRTANAADMSVGTRAKHELHSVEFDKQLAKQLLALDPTQHLLVSVVTEWAEKRLRWRTTSRRQSLTAPPKLRLLVLGTAGTSKTHSAKCAITRVRRTLGSYDSVLTLAFSGVASANLGSDSRTIDSIFHTNNKGAGDDLASEQLDKLVAELRAVELLVIDEISTCGAVTLEIVSRRLHQVARVLWRERFKAEPPDDLGPFGGIGVVLMGDFA